jgi:hypothetical protein
MHGGLSSRRRDRCHSYERAADQLTSLIVEAPPLAGVKEGNLRCGVCAVEDVYLMVV